MQARGSMMGGGEGCGGSGSGIWRGRRGAFGSLVGVPGLPLVLDDILIQFGIILSVCCCVQWIVFWLQLRSGQGPRL